MYVAQIEVTGVAPLGEMQLSFLSRDGEPRLVTVVEGGGGVGKTALLQVLASTRPGNVMALIGRTIPGSPEPAHATCAWLLGDDDPDRPHPLTLCTPSALRRREDDIALMRRRETSLFDRRAKESSGFVFVALSAARWYSRQAISLNAPLRTLAHYQVRASAGLDDAAHHDLTGVTKQALAYAAIASALAPQTQRDRNRLRESSERLRDTRLLGSAMLETVDSLVSIAGFRYEGLDCVSFEPRFRSPANRVLDFDRLPHRVRDLAAIAALPLRALWASYPDQDPRTAEGVVAIDEVDRHQDDACRQVLISRLRLAFPRVQWILTTTSPTLAASVDAESVFAFRRLPESDEVQLYTGTESRVH